MSPVAMGTGLGMVVWERRVLSPTVACGLTSGLRRRRRRRSRRRRRRGATAISAAAAAAVTTAAATTTVAAAATAGSRRRRRRGCALVPHSPERFVRQGAAIHLGNGCVCCLSLCKVRTQPAGATVSRLMTLASHFTKRLECLCQEAISGVPA